MSATVPLREHAKTRRHEDVKAILENQDNLRAVRAFVTSCTPQAARDAGSSDAALSVVLGSLSSTAIVFSSEGRENDAFIGCERTRRLLAWPFAQTSGTAQVSTKEPGPVVTPAVRKLLDEAAARFNKGDPAGALATTEQALTLARQTGDRRGEAQTVRVRAVSTLQLNRIGESGDGWREALSVWQALGEGPGQVEAIGFQSLIGFLTKAPDALERLRQSIALARAETRSPRTAASRLFDVGLQLKARQLLAPAREAVAAAIGIEERVGVPPEQLADALGTLGELHAASGQPTLAREPVERALATSIGGGPWAAASCSPRLNRRRPTVKPTAAARSRHGKSSVSYGWERRWSCCPPARPAKD